MFYDILIIDMGVLIVSDGCCLMVIVMGDDWYDVEILVEIVFKINLDVWIVGKCVNLECVFKVGDELGGYIVLGYVDGVVEVIVM